MFRFMSKKVKIFKKVKVPIRNIVSDKSEWHVKFSSDVDL